ncbi:hypothetical protein K1719_044301 [Acacia pycnantha]|nr:hypothetical protein K1719_044301 [Acacia pycnantha]
MNSPKLSFWRDVREVEDPAYYPLDTTVGVSVRSEYKGYKLENVDVVVGEKRNVWTEKKPLMINLNQPQPLFCGYRCCRTALWCQLLDGRR